MRHDLPVLDLLEEGSDWHVNSEGPERKYRHALDCFTTAVYTLASSHEPLGRRLYAATAAIWDLQPSDLPPSFREDFEWIRQQCTEKGPHHYGDSAVRRTLYGMRGGPKATRIAARIVRVHEDLMSHILCGFFVD